MASVINTKANYYASNCKEEASQFVQSEGDILIKQLAQKQSDVELTLEKHLQQEKEFQISHNYKPVTELTRGVCTYKHFKKLSSDLEEGISDKKEDENRSENKYVSRHMHELALAVKPNSLETKLLQFALSCKTLNNSTSDCHSADHPINNLQEIEQQLFKRLSTDSNPLKTVKTVLRKRKQLLETLSDPIGPQTKPTSNKPNSLWDIMDPVNLNLKRPKRVYTCQNKKLFTIYNDNIVDIKSKDYKEEKNCSKNNRSYSFVANFTETARNDRMFGTRLTEEDIKKIPKFYNYKKGTPSQVLYVKNLSKSIKEEDLLLLFEKYQEPNKPRIIYTLMRTGKMRGQAFINFHCVHIAVKAMEEVNGYILRGKPIIMQYSSACKKI